MTTAQRSVENPVKSKYETWHDQIIDRARIRSLGCYRESHHIIPRSLDGGDDADNLVDLTYREHFLVHWLLTKFYTGYAKRKMIYALHAMTLPMGTRPMIAGWQIEAAKRALKDEVLRRAAARAAIQLRLRKAKRTSLASQVDAANRLNFLRKEDRQAATKMAREMVACAHADGELKRTGKRRKAGKQRGRVYDPAYEFRSA